MKRISVVIFLAISVWTTLTPSFTVLAALSDQSQTTEENSSVLTAEEKEKMISEIQNLGVLMGVRDAQSQQPAEKNMADVADRALDMVEKSVVSIGQSLEKVAPDIW